MPGHPCRLRQKEKKLPVQNKGQKNEVRSFLDAACEGKNAVVLFKEIHSMTLATLKTLESLRTGGCVTGSLD